MPGIDPPAAASPSAGEGPSIHRFAKEMNRRVKPGDDDEFD
jgi:hypothetical protein